MSLKKFDNRRPRLTFRQELALHHEEEADLISEWAWIESRFFSNGLDFDLELELELDREQEDADLLYADLDPYYDPYYHLYEPELVDWAYRF